MNNITNEINEFKKVLIDLNINLNQNSKLNLSLERLIDYLTFQETNKNDIVHLRYCPKIIRQSIFLDNFIRNINKHRNRNDFHLLKNHLALLLETNFAQNDSSPDLFGIEKENDNKAWEMFLVIALMNINAEIISIDNPIVSNSNKKNVDIVTNLEGVKFGFECKVPGSDSLNAKSFLGLIKRGINQIIESDVDCGIVCLNMKNIIEHNIFLNSFEKNNYKCFSDIEEPQNILQNEMFKNWDNILISELEQWVKDEKNDNDKIKFIYKELFQNNKKVCKGWFNYYSTGSICKTNESVNALSLQRLNPQGIVSEDFCLESVVANQINNGFFEKEKNYSLLKYLKATRDIK